MIIDTDNYEGAGITTAVVPGGEVIVGVPESSDPHVHIYAKIRNAQDALTLMEVISCFKMRGTSVHLLMAYFPGARQDRMQAGKGLTVQNYALMFSGANSITVADLHSEAAAAIIKNTIPYMNFRQLPFESYIPRMGIIKPDIVLAPDKGARGRAEAVAKILGVDTVLHCGKERTENGQLTKVVLPDYNRHFRGRFLIVDDICDGGRTFVNILKQIRAECPYGFPVVDLCVTHDIFSQGFSELITQHEHYEPGFSNIYTTDSFFRPTLDTPDNVKYVGLMDSYLEGLTPT